MTSRSNWIINNTPRWVILCIDIILAVFSVGISYLLVDAINSKDLNISDYLYPLLIVLGFRASAFFITKSYTGIIRHTSTQDAVKIFLAVSLSTLSLLTVFFASIYLFNAPFENLTVYVGENDNRGNLEKIYLFETNKTIIAKKGRVLNINEKNYLELIDGFVHEKNENSKIKIIKFKNTLYDFTKYKTNLTTYPKLQERNILWLFNNFQITDVRKEETLSEIHKRIFKPLFIPIIALMCCFILYGNNEKFNLVKLRFTVFTLTVLFIIFLEILISLSSSSTFFQYFLYSLPMCGGLVVYFLLQKFIQSEPLAK